MSHMNESCHTRIHTHARARGQESKGRCVWGGRDLEAVEAVGNMVIAIRVEQTMDLFTEIVAALLDTFVPPLLWGAALYRCTHLQ